MKKFKVGILGNGFVGEAISFAFSTVSDIYVYDIDPLKSLCDLESVHNCDFVFICVPTPMFEDGSQDLSYVESVFKKATNKPIYILKSTILPGTTDQLSEKYSNFKIIFSPEFLTERTAKLDMLTQSRIILGGELILTEKVKSLFNQRFKIKNIIQTDSKTAELIKYMNNTFFATKVSIMNEFKLLCDKIEANWEDALNGFVTDGRIGDSHLNVPGHDGELGYGGTCFPKDVNALICFSKIHNIELNTIKGGWKTNLNVRLEKDWEEKEGRSVSFKKNKIIPNACVNNKKNKL
jgi:nucleotide sugar dehydrogenase